MAKRSHYYDGKPHMIDIADECVPLVCDAYGGILQPWRATLPMLGVLLMLGNPGLGVQMHKPSIWSDSYPHERYSKVPGWRFMIAAKKVGNPLWPWEVGVWHDVAVTYQPDRHQCMAVALTTGERCKATSGLGSHFCAAHSNSRKRVGSVVLSLHGE